MNDLFSTKRFALLLKKHLTEEYKHYLTLAAGALGIMFVFSGLATVTNLGTQVDTKMPEMIFLIGFTLGGGIFASLAYQFFQHHAKGIRFLELPASHFEKIAVMFIITQVIFFVGFLGVFYLNNWFWCMIYNTFHTTPLNIAPQRLKYFHADLFDLNSHSAKTAMVLFLVISAISHFGSLCFQKIAFIKTSLIVVILGAVILLLNYYYMSSLIPETNMPGGIFFHASVRLGDQRIAKGFVLLPEIWEKTINYLLPGVLYISFWTGSYWKLREKQL